MVDIEGRLRALEERYAEIEAELSEPESYADVDRTRVLGQERARLDEVVSVGRAWRAARDAAREAEELIRGEEDPEMVALAEEEVRTQHAAVDAADARLRALLLPTDPNDQRDVIVEVRAGTGGEEAALFAAEL